MSQSDSDGLRRLAEQLERALGDNFASESQREIWRHAFGRVLRSADSPVAARTWHPIATAPKDGTRILINSEWLDLNGEPLGVEITHWSREGLGWTSAEKAPTRWSALPNPPKEPDGR